MYREPQASSRKQQILEGLLKHPRTSEFLAERLERMADVLSLRLSSLTLVLEDLWDRHNFSAIVRSSEALGLCRVHVVEKLHRYRKAPGVTSGADRWLQVARHAQLSGCVDSLRDAGFLLASADVGDGCVPLEEVPVDRPLAIVLGSEKTGLSEEARNLSDLHFTVPMHGFTESFNVSVSAAVALYSLQRRRRQAIHDVGDLPITEAVELAWQWLDDTVQRRERGRVKRS